jgi:hypothetical protein
LKYIKQNDTAQPGPELLQPLSLSGFWRLTAQCDAQAGGYLAINGRIAGFFSDEKTRLAKTGVSRPARKSMNIPIDAEWHFQQILNKSRVRKDYWFSCLQAITTTR